MDTDLKITVTLPPGTVDQILYEAALASVREIVERWHHRPAPNKLRLTPVCALQLKPVPIWQREWIKARELATGENPHSPFGIRHSPL